MALTIEQAMAEAQAQNNSSAAGAPPAPGGSSDPAAGAGGGGMPAAPSPQDASSTAAPAEGALGSAVSGATDMASFGLMDELSAGLETLGVPGGAGKAVGWTDPNGWGGAYAANLAAERAQMEADKAQHPYAFFGGGAAGALLMPVKAGMQGGIGSFVRAGALQGGLYGAGSGTTLENRAEGGATGAVIGGATAGVLGRLTQLISPRLANLFGRTGGEVAQEADAGAQELTTSKPTILGSTTDGQPILAMHAAEAVETGAGETEQIVLPGFEEADLANAGENGRADLGATASTGTATRQALDAFQTDMENALAKGRPAADITWESDPALAAKLGEWRLGNMSDSDVAVATAKALTNVMAGRPPLTDPELYSKAGTILTYLGDDAEQAMAVGKELAANPEHAPVGAMVFKTLWSRAADEIHEMYLSGVDWATASDDLLKEAGQRIYNLMSLQQFNNQVKTGWGRLGRVLQLPNVDDYFARIEAGGEAEAGGVGIEEANPGQPAPLPSSRDGFDAFFQKWAMTGGDPKAIAALLDDKLAGYIPSPWDYAKKSVSNFFMGNILSAPKTFAKELAFPNITLGLHTVARSLGAAAASLDPTVSAEQRQAMWMVAQNASKAYFTNFGQIQVYAKQALLAAQVDRSLIGGTSEDASAYARQFTSLGPITPRMMQTLGVDPAQAGSMGYTLGNALNFLPRTVTMPLHSGMAEFTQNLLYGNEVRLNAMVQAAQQGLEGDAADAYVTNAVGKAWSDTGKAQNSALLDQAQRLNMFRTPGEPGSGLRKVSDLINELRGSSPVIRFLLPIYNVSANSLAEVLRAIPFASKVPGVGALWHNTAQELSGELGPVRQADAYGRTLLGGMFLMAGEALNRTGSLTGAAPTNPKDREAWEGRGSDGSVRIPYALKVGDNWVALNEIPMLGGLMSIPATIRDVTQYHPDDNVHQNAVLAGAGALAQWFLDRSAMKTAAEVLSLGSDPTAGIGKVVNQVTSGVASGMIPFSGAIRSLDNAVDPYVRMKDSWGDYIQQIMPGLSERLPEERNVLGEPVLKANAGALNQISPVTVASGIDRGHDPVLSELGRLWQQTGYGADADPNATIGHGYFDPGQVNLEDGSSLRDRFSMERQTMQIGGKTLRESLEHLFDNPIYQNGVDGNSTQRTTSAGQISRAYLVSQTFRQYNDAIKAQTALGSDTARDWMVAGAAKHRDDAYLRGVSAEDLVKNPDLYQAHGVVKGVYDGALLQGAASSLARDFEKTPG